MKNKKKLIIIISIVIILIIGIAISIILLTQKETNTNENNNQSQEVQDDTNNDNEDNNTINDEGNNEENKEVKQEESNKNNNDVMQDTKKEETKKNNSTNNTSSNAQPRSTPEQPKETTPVATETKYYPICNGVNIEDNGKKLTESQIRAKYPVVTNLKSSAEIAEDLYNDLPGFTSQVGIPNSLSNVLTTCQWTSTDNRSVLGNTPIVELYLNNTFDKYQTLAPEAYNKYLNIWNSLAYKDAYGKKRTIAEYYYINGKKQWKWNPNGFHF